MLKVLLLSLSRQYTVDGQYIPSLFIEPEVRHDKTSYILGGFRNSQSDVIFAHAHIRGRQRFVQLYGICVKCGFIFWENGLL